VVEDLNVKGLSRGPLSRSVADVGWGTFLRMLEYKAKWYGATLIVAPRSFPSTRLCSRCGHLHGKMPLSQRVFRCEACGLEMDRDLNAALNLKAYGLAHLTGPTASSAGSHACGDPSGGGTAYAGNEPKCGFLGGLSIRLTPTRRELNDLATLPGLQRATNSYMQGINRRNLRKFYPWTANPYTQGANIGILAPEGVLVG
jgi:putative transposase